MANTSFAPLLKIKSTIPKCSFLTTKNEHLGIVDFIFNNGSNDVLAIKNNNKSISYIAFIKKNISKIDNDKIIMCDESV